MAATGTLDKFPNTNRKLNLLNDDRSNHPRFSMARKQTSVFELLSIDEFPDDMT